MNKMKLNCVDRILRGTVDIQMFNIVIHNTVSPDMTEVMINVERNVEKNVEVTYGVTDEV